MKLWFRKVSVILIAILTLGLYVPPAYLDTDAAETSDVTSKAKVAQEPVRDNVISKQDIFRETNPIDTISELAKIQTITKLGPKILNTVEDDFIDEILLKVEDTIITILQSVDTEDVKYYGVSEQPTPGYGEKIFNLYDVRTNKDIAKFHVRRENRPLEGYWFNFHYHLSDDNFEKHYEMADIYYNKNTPPKWMS